MSVFTGLITKLLTPGRDAAKFDVVYNYTILQDGLGFDYLTKGYSNVDQGFLDFVDARLAILVNVMNQHGYQAVQDPALQKIFFAQLDQAGQKLLEDLGVQLLAQLSETGVVAAQQKGKGYKRHAANLPSIPWGAQGAPAGKAKKKP